MNRGEVVVEGTLKPDGTLELDTKPNLSPGRVKIALRSASEPMPTSEGWWPFMQRVRKELEASGAAFLNEEEMQTHLDWLRESDRIDDLLRNAEEECRKQEQ